MDKNPSMTELAQELVREITRLQRRFPLTPENLPGLSANFAQFAFVAGQFAAHVTVPATPAGELKNNLCEAVTAMERAQHELREAENLTQALKSRTGKNPAPAADGQKNHKYLTAGAENHLQEIMHRLNLARPQAQALAETVPART